MTNISLNIILYSLIFLFSFSISLFFLIITIRIIIGYREKKFTEIRMKIEEELPRVISSNFSLLTHDLARKYKSSPDILTKALIGYWEVLKGPTREKLKEIFEYSLKKKYLKDIYSSRTMKRLKAVRPFITFSEPSDIPHIIKLLNDKPIIRLVTISAFSQSPNLASIFYLFQTFEEDKNPNLQAYINLMIALGKKAEPYIKKYLKKSLSTEKLSMLIELVGSIPLPALYQELMVYSNHKEKEIRIKAARALGNLSLPLPEVIKTLIKFVADKDWEVKAQALKSLGKLRSIEALDILTEALQSPFWYCRLNAGYALANTRPEGIKRLVQMARQRKDKYAAQMATMVLEDINYSRA